jgi:cystathionine beta-lyase
MLYPTGLSAVSTALLTLLSPGDELLMVDSVYGPTRRLCDGVLKRLGITTRYYDPLVGGGIADLIGERTRVVFTESPGSLTFRGAGRAGDRGSGAGARRGGGAGQ